MNKVMVINPPNKPFSERSLLIEPIDVLEIATYLQDQGNEVKVLDMDVKQIPPEGVREYIECFKPGVTVVPFDYHVPLHRGEAITGVNQIAQIARENGSRTVVGGKTSKHYPHIFLENGFDVTINGEMEQILSELSKSSWTPQDLSRVEGISYLENGSVKRTPDRKTKLVLDKLPITDRRLVDLNDYIDVRSILSSRGCVSRCGFCATPDFWGAWRAKSPQRVVDEIEYLERETGTQKVIFLDDNSTVNKRRMNKIANEIIQRGLQGTYGGLGMVSSYDEEVIKQMHEAGFRWIHYGGESGSQEVLDRMHKKITPDQIRQAIKGSKNAGLRVRTSWIYDLPGTDEDAVKRTNDLILSTEPQEVRLHYLSPRVGTEFSEKSKNGLPPQYIHSSVPQKGLSECDLEAVVRGVQELTDELQNRGYEVVRDVSEWNRISKIKNPKFVSFCPSRYGLGWER